MHVQIDPAFAQEKDETENGMPLKSTLNCPNLCLTTPPWKLTQGAWRGAKRAPSASGGSRVQPAVEASAISIDASISTKRNSVAGPMHTPVDAKSMAGRSHKSVMESLASAAEHGMEMAKLYTALLMKFSIVMTPLVIVAILGAFQVYQSSLKVQMAEYVREDIERADRLRVLIDRMQVERGTSCMYHSSIRSGTDTDGSIQRLRARRRAETDLVLDDLIGIEWVSDRFPTIQDFIVQWNVTREMIDSLDEDTCDRIMLTIHDLVGHIIHMLFQSLTKNTRLTRLLTAYGSWTLGIEFLELDGSTDGLFLLASFTTEELHEYDEKLEVADQSVGSNQSYTNYTALQLMVLQMADPSMRIKEFSGNQSTEAQFWFSTISQRIGLLRSLGSKVDDNLRGVLDRNVDDVSAEFLMLMISLIATIILAVLATSYGGYHAYSIHKQSKELEAQLGMQTEKLAREQQKMADLLHELLPKHVVKQLSMGKAVMPESFECVTVMFTDIVGFTPICAQSTPVQVVKMLNLLFTNVDEILHSNNCYKLETVGDCIVASSGVPERCGDEHSGNIAGASLDVVHMLHHMRVPHLKHQTGVIRMRVGFHTGGVSAGVVGLRAPKFCLFGDTVNTASRMESNGMPLRVHMSDAAYKHLSTYSSLFRTRRRGTMTIKGKGLMMTYWVTGAEGHPYKFEMTYEEKDTRVWECPQRYICRNKCNNTWDTNASASALILGVFPILQALLSAEIYKRDKSDRNYYLIK